MRDKSDDRPAGPLLPFNGRVERASLIQIDDQPTAFVFIVQLRLVAQQFDSDAERAGSKSAS